MIYLILIVAFAILVALLLLLRSFYQLRADFARFRRKISEQSNDYDLNTDRQKEPPMVLGNVLHCKNGCDAGVCGMGFACQTCPVRLVIKNSFKNKRDFNQVEATMALYNQEHKVQEVDVTVSGELVYAYGNLRYHAPCYDASDRKLSAIMKARFSPMPRTSVRRSGCSERIVRVSSPKAETMRVAVEGPTPWMRPLPRKRSIPRSVVGVFSSQETQRNWRP